MKKVLLIMAACGIAASAQATVTYSLTTHVDGRTLTAEASAPAGSELIGQMPQAL